MNKHSVALKALQDDFVKVSEVYGAKFNINRDDLWALGKLSEELGELTQAYLRLHGRARTAVNQTDLQLSLEDEVSDLLGMLLIFAKMQNVDVAQAVERKWLKYLPQE